MKHLTQVVVFAASFSILAGGALAAKPTSETANQNASACGQAHAANAAANGNFGWLGDAGGTPGYHGGATGQEAGATGYNNSHTSCHES